ncbi:ATP-binding cassette domain-containing protein [Piscinibacter terrae]|uniref:ATP-binding cassette domain-containing protein n=1 Tax=Piscinibacter terrae TaxID=2496871 RepID=A0A3N7HTI2_9BURK|nr:ATP-binding cassette domain-containing protein [Albitalea terrae]RQP25627.1 ATP-binding cassette domain-containing protein [Albitalea terrae]
MLSVRGLVKRYGARTALDGIDLDIPRGRFVALLGPNGAGKSTLFQVLTGLFASDAGEVQVDGIDLRRHAARALARIGVVFQQPSLDLDLSLARNLQLHADLHGLRSRPARQRMAEGCERFGLADRMHRPVRELSGGQRRKVELIRAGLHEPGLLLMDEATAGLDPQSRRDLLAEMNGSVTRRGASVLWATHLVDEAEAADRVMVLHRGRVLADGAPAEVAQRLGGGSLEQAFLRATA